MSDPSTYHVTSPFSAINEAIDAIAAGRIVIVVDSEDREDEGDFICAAEKVTPQMIHFMARIGRGQLCLPLLPDTAERLELSLMVPSSEDASAPRFAIPIDHRRCRTGISPLERAFTIQQIVEPTTTASDFVRPGHVSPLIAEQAGVLARTGHTEATVDLCRLAGCAAVGITCEICSRDGLNMASRSELKRLSVTYQLPIIEIDDLVAYRQASQPCGSSTLCSAH